MMNVIEYEKQFEDILEGRNKEYPYDSEEYVNYVKMNKARIRRWNKTGKIIAGLSETVEHIDSSMNWLVITEPWCGDAAHSHVFIEKLAKLNPKINLTFQNRDTSESEIDKYLTNGSRSIPMLVVRDANGQDLFTWGPRPKEAQDMVMDHKKDALKSPDEKKKELQKWYNKDKGVSIQEELHELLKNRVSTK